MTHPQCICVIPHFPQRRMQLSRHDVWTLLEQGESKGGWGEGEKGKGGGGQGRLQRSRLETAMPPPCLASPCPEPARIDREKVRGRKPGSSHEHIPPLVVHGISRCLRLASPLPLPGHTHIKCVYTSTGTTRALPRFLATIPLDSGNIAPVRSPHEATVAQRQAQGRRRCQRRFG